MKPNDDRVIIKPIPAAEKTKSGLFVPLEAQKVAIWEVVSIGPSSLECKNCKTHRETELREGMLVMINENAGMDFSEGDQHYRVIRFSDIHLFDEKK